MFLAFQRAQKISAYKENQTVNYAEEIVAN